MGLINPALVGATYPRYKISTIKKHPSLIPLVFALSLGVAFASTYLFRLITSCPEYSWRKHSNPHPWQRYKQSDQIKMMAVSIDYKNLAYPEERPDI